MFTSQNRFLIIGCGRNYSATVEQFLKSLYAQSHDNWKLILVDDVSTDDSASHARSLSNRFGVSTKVDIISNTERKFEVANVLRALNCADVRPSDIVCRIDPDDYLVDNDAFRIINEFYGDDRAQDVEALWTMHRWFYEGEPPSRTNISATMPPTADPYKYPWVSSHLKTFRKRLIDGVPDTNFRGADGNYIKRAGDQAIYLPVLSKTKKRLFLPLVTYAYRCSQKPEVFQTDDARFQAEEANYLRSRGYVS